jgi:hypothetical protein
MVITIVNRCSIILEQITSKVSHLLAIVEIVGFGERFEDIVEPVEQGDPVI